MRVVLSGGGTGGHVYPALAVAAALQQRSAGNGPLEMLYIGIRGRLDEELMTSEIMPFRTVRAGALRGRSPWQFARGLFNLFLGTLEARSLLRRFRPHVVFATGGYASVPVALAARLTRRPLVVYLPDIRPGWAVRLMARLARVIAVTNEASLPYLPAGKTRVTGYPVRKAFTTAQRQESYSRLGLDPTRKTLLIAGGSQGAHSINKLAAKHLPQLLDLCQIIHISGESDYAWLDGLRQKLPQELAARYHLYRYLRDEMPWAMAAADLALTRAGASTLGELPAVGLPAVLIPGPFSDQKENARYLDAKGAAIVLANSHLARAKEEIERLLNDEERLRKMSEAARSLAQPDAADRIADLIIEIGRESNGNNGPGR